MARRGQQRCLERGIYEDETGFSVKVQVRGARQELRFPPTTDRETLRKNRDQLRADLHSETPAGAERGTLARDVALYLKRIENTPGFKADRSHLQAWIDRLGSRLRSRITAADVELAFAAWRKHGTYVGGRGRRERRNVKRPASEKTLLHRYRVLKAVYRKLDGPKATTPCDDVVRPKPGASTPVGVHATIVQEVADALKQRTMGTPLHSPERQDHARYLMLATTLQRAAQIQRARTEDFHLAEQFWIVRGAKGGPSHAIHLNRDMRVAVKAFLAAKAEGPFDEKKLLALARAHGWPTTHRVGLRSTRASGAIDALARDADLGDIQAMLGHTSIETTRKFYAGIQRLRQKNVGKRLEGRLKIG